MDSPNTILVYTDYKSPYAFLAKDLIYELEDQFDVNVEWLPTRSTFQVILGALG
jgi:2-hydroxychromene-2-carboxylate isomerase